MARRFQLVEAVSGGEVADQIEADTYAEAAAQILESMGYQLLEVKDSKRNVRLPHKQTEVFENGNHKSTGQ